MNTRLVLPRICSANGDSKNEITHTKYQANTQQSKRKQRNMAHSKRANFAKNHASRACTGLSRRLLRNSSYGAAHHQYVALMSEALFGNAGKHAVTDFKNNRALAMEQIERAFGNTATRLQQPRCDPMMHPRVVVYMNGKPMWL